MVPGGGRDRSAQLAAYSKLIAENRSPMSTVQCCTGVLRNLKRQRTPSGEYSTRHPEGIADQSCRS
jgi:hypothetical protein